MFTEILMTSGCKVLADELLSGTPQLHTHCVLVERPLVCCLQYHTNIKCAGKYQYQQWSCLDLKQLFRWKFKLVITLVWGQFSHMFTWLHYFSVLGPTLDYHLLYILIVPVWVSSSLLSSGPKTMTNNIALNLLTPERKPYTTPAITVATSRHIIQV